jgi:DUF1680 family protein
VSKPSVELSDAFWAPRVVQLRTTTLPVLLERLEAHGVVDAFRRLRIADRPPRDASWMGSFIGDSDLYKWTEAAALAGRPDLAAPVVAAIAAAQDADGYLHTRCGHDGVARYGDLGLGHELYCMGHLLEAAVSHHEATGDDALLGVARRVAAHVASVFGPGRDERVDAHPELELALCRLARATGERALLPLAAWMLEQHLARAGVALDALEPSGHAVRFVYLVSGRAELALATGEARWRDAALRLWQALLARHSYCTGAVGGRWSGEAVGRPYELDDETSYAESCASVAMAQLARRIWRLTGDPACLDALDVLLFNALPAAVGADGASWCYANALAWSGAREQNLWVLPFEYGPAMALRWLPPRRQPWLDVMCCPPNLARAFGAVPSWVAESEGGEAPTLRVLHPLACRIRDPRWDVALRSGWPFAGELEVEVRRAPAGGRLLVRRPGEGFEELAPGGRSRLALPLRAQWWAARPELSAMAGKLFLRRGPVVYALDDRALPGVDLRRVAVDPSAPPTTRSRARRRSTVRSGGARRSGATPSSRCARTPNGPTASGSSGSGCAARADPCAGVSRAGGSAEIRRRSALRTASQSAPSALGASGSVALST